MKTRKFKRMEMCMTVKQLHAIIEKVPDDYVVQFGDFNTEEDASTIDVQHFVEERTGYLVLRA